MKKILQQQEILSALRALPQMDSVYKASLFGSYANGTATSESDVDILVEFMPGGLPSLFEFIGMKNDLQEKLGVPIDLVTPDALNKYMKDDILASARTIYVK